MIPLMELRLFGALALVAALLFGWQHYTTKLRDEGKALCEAAHLKADQAERARRDAAQVENDRETQRLSTLDRDHAVSLAVASVGLRNAGAQAISSLGHSAPVAVSAPASSATGVPALVSGEVETRLRALAKIADERRTPGLACERSYDSLTP